MRNFRPTHKRPAFTLVEMLVVIVIIGMLAAILLPVLRGAQMRARNAAIAVEISDLGKAVAAYKEKYSDYPPDFSNKGVVRRHIYKAWPNIDPLEFQKAWNVFWVVPGNDNNHLSRVDPAEALVFWLSGFSSNARRPFTGKGGPFLELPPVNSGILVMNPDRENGLAGFDEGRLTMNTRANTLSGPPPNVVLMSTDEVGLHGRPDVLTTPFGEVDQFPVYMIKNRETPYVYFDSRTYQGTYSGAVPPVLLSPLPVYPPVAFAVTTKIKGLAAAYRSDQQKNATPLDPVPVDPNSTRWLNKDSFQIVCAGQDNHFGGIRAFLLMRRYPSGTNYLSPEIGDDDNITNFSEGSLLKDMKP